MADKQISQLVAATTIENEDLFVMQQGGTAKKLSGQKLADFVYQSAADQIERVDEAVEQAQAAVDYLEEQKNEIAEAVASMAELGTDTTLSTPGMAADAAATGEVKDIALARFEQAEITGVSIATFDDGADNVPVKKLIVDISPVQSGSGDPSPDNIRPITGWTGANVTRTGKNLIGTQHNTVSGLVPNSNGTFTSSQTYTLYVFPVQKGKNVYFTCNGTITGYICSTGTSAITSATTQFGRTALTPTTPVYPATKAMNGSYLVLALQNESDLNNIFISYNYSDTPVYGLSDSLTYSITFPDAAGTVYGGTLDVTNGVLTVDKVTKTISSSDSFYSFATGTANANALVYLDPVPYIGSEISAYNGAVSSTGKENPKYWASQRKNENPTNGHYSFALGSNFVRFYMTEDYSGISDAAGFKSAFAETQLVYTLATPVTYTLTPPVVRTLLALNNIWADTGNILDLIYRKMPITADELENTLESMIAGVEETMEATQNYTAGKLVVAAHKLYHIDSNIASGETLVPGTNCYVTTIAYELANLASDIDIQLGALGNLATLTYQVVT